MPDDVGELIELPEKPNGKPAPSVEPPPAAMPTATAAGPAFDPSLVNLLYDALASIQVSIVRALGYSLDQAAVMRYSVEEKAALLEPTAKLLNKYSDKLGAYSEEIALGLALGGILYGKVLMLQQMTPAGQADKAAA